MFGTSTSHGLVVEVTHSHLEKTKTREPTLKSSVSATQASTPGRESAQGTAVDATYLSQIVAHHMSGQSLGP